jgi:RND family efflux transporter MFP subunit
MRAQLVPRNFTTLASEIGARIVRLPTVEGGRFSKGDPLVLMDCVVLDAQRRKAQAAFEAAETILQASRRLVDLNSIGKVEIETLRGESAKARAEVAVMAAMTSKCRIDAPFNGRLAEQKVREQQYVQPGQALVDIIEDDALEAEFLAPSRLFRLISIGSRIIVRIDETRADYPARVVRMGARVDPVSLTIKINAAIEGKHPELLAGMSGDAMLGPSN